MKTFSQLLTAIKRSDEALQTAVQEACAYVIYQYHKNGRVVDGAKVNLKAQLVEAAPKWLGEKLKKLPLNTGKRDLTLDERRAENMASAMVCTIFLDQKEQRRIAKEQREARKASKVEAAPVEQIEVPAEQDAIEGEYVTANPVMFGLVINGELIEATEAEMLALAEHLTLMRMEAFQPLKLVA